MSQRDCSPSTVERSSPPRPPKALQEVTFLDSTCNSDQSVDSEKTGQNVLPEKQCVHGRPYGLVCFQCCKSKNHPDFKSQKKRLLQTSGVLNAIPARTTTATSDDTTIPQKPLALFPQPTGFPLATDDAVQGAIAGTAVECAAPQNKASIQLVQTGNISAEQDKKPTLSPRSGSLHPTSSREAKVLHSEIRSLETQLLNKQRLLQDMLLHRPVVKSELPVGPAAVPKDKSIWDRLHKTPLQKTFMPTGIAALRNEISHINTAIRDHQKTLHLISSQQQTRRSPRAGTCKRSVGIGASTGVLNKSSVWERLCADTAKKSEQPQKNQVRAKRPTVASLVRPPDHISCIAVPNKMLPSQIARCKAVEVTSDVPLKTLEDDMSRIVAAADSDIALKEATCISPKLLTPILEAQVQHPSTPEKPLIRLLTEPGTPPSSTTNNERGQSPPAVICVTLSTHPRTVLVGTNPLTAVRRPVLYSDQRSAASTASTGGHGTSGGSGMASAENRSGRRVPADVVRKMKQKYGSGAGANRRPTSSLPSRNTKQSDGLGHLSNDLRTPEGSLVGSSVLPRVVDASKRTVDFTSNDGGSEGPDTSSGSARAKGARGDGRHPTGNSSAFVICGDRLVHPTSFFGPSDVSPKIKRLTQGTSNQPPIALQKSTQLCSRSSASVSTHHVKSPITAPAFIPASRGRVVDGNKRTVDLTGPTLSASPLTSSTPTVDERSTTPNCQGKQAHSPHLFLTRFPDSRVTDTFHRTVNLVGTVDEMLFHTLPTITPVTIDQNSPTSIIQSSNSRTVDPHPRAVQLISSIERIHEASPNRSRSPALPSPVVEISTSTEVTGVVLDEHGNRSVSNVRRVVDFASSSAANSEDLYHQEALSSGSSEAYSHIRHSNDGSPKVPQNHLVQRSDAGTPSPGASISDSPHAVFYCVEMGSTTTTSATGDQMGSSVFSASVGQEYKGDRMAEYGIESPLNGMPHLASVTSPVPAAMDDNRQPRSPSADVSLNQETVKASEFFRCGFEDQMAISPVGHEIAAAALSPTPGCGVSKTAVAVPTVSSTASGVAGNLDQVDNLQMLSPAYLASAVPASFVGTVPVTSSPSASHGKVSQSAILPKAVVVLPLECPSKSYSQTTVLTSNCRKNEFVKFASPTRPAGLSADSAATSSSSASMTSDLPPLVSPIRIAGTNARNTNTPNAFVGSQQPRLPAAPGPMAVLRPADLAAPPPASLASALLFSSSNATSYVDANARFVRPMGTAAGGAGVTQGPRQAGRSGLPGRLFSAERPNATLPATTTVIQHLPFAENVGGGNLPSGSSRYSNASLESCDSPLAAEGAKIPTPCNDGVGGGPTGSTASSVISTLSPMSSNSGSGWDEEEHPSCVPEEAQHQDDDELGEPMVSAASSSLSSYAVL